MKTPVAVTVIDQETMDREGVKDIRDIATINGPSTPIISLRGVRSTNETELGDSAVGVHLDGIHSPRMQANLVLMFDNERVEVLRGPQGSFGMPRNYGFGISKVSDLGGGETMPPSFPLLPSSSTKASSRCRPFRWEEAEFRLIVD